MDTAVAGKLRPATSSRWPMNVSVGSPDIPTAFRSSEGGPMSTVTRFTEPSSISRRRCLSPARVAMSSS